MDHALFNNILILLTIAIVIHAFCQKLKIPYIIGYILIGVLVGPHAIGVVRASTSITLLAEFGLVFLMFNIGLEFSLSRLVQLKKDVFGFGLLQVLISVLITLLIGIMLKMSLAESLIVGFIVAMSSTAIVLKQLTEQQEINAPFSQHAFGILLFQDLAVIPILIFIPNLSELNATILISDLIISLIKGVVAIVLILFIGKRILRPTFYYFSSKSSLELFTLSTLFIVLGAAWLTEWFGLSMALGAFLAGMMLGETEFRHQIKADIRPFRDVLLGFFFITIGMQFNPSIITMAWNWILLLLFALILFKIVVIYLIGRFFTKSRAIALQTGLVLSQGGEFSFAILINALSNQLLSYDYAQVIIGALLASMILSPIIIKNHHRIIKVLLPKNGITNTQTEDWQAVSSNLKDHIILCGYGRVGQNIARFLDRAHLKYIALDLDSSRVKSARLAGDHVFYANAADYEILKLSNIAHAKAIIISFLNTYDAINMIEQVRKNDMHLPIIVRTHDDNDTQLLYEKGATEVIPEIFEASLMIASHILLMMKVAAKEVYQWIDQSRNNRYDLLRMIFPGQEALTLEEADTNTGLRVIALTKNSFAVGRTIKNLQLNELKVRITTIRRGADRMIDPNLDTILLESDVLVVFGALIHIERAENKILMGD